MILVQFFQSTATTHGRPTRTNGGGLLRKEMFSLGADVTGAGAVKHNAANPYSSRSLDTGPLTTENFTTTMTAK